MLEAVKLPILRLDGVPLHSIDEHQCIGHILRAIDEQTGGVVVTHNLDHLRRLKHEPEFARLCQEATLRVADGMPLVWASRVLGRPLPQRVAGSSLILTLTAAAAGRGRSVFLLGGDAGTADAAAAELVRRNPGLKIAGTFYPPMGFEDNPAAMTALETILRDSAADIVYVAVGSPKQERLIGRMRHLLPSAWWLGVGISFSFVAGDIRRAPIWMQHSGLEWLHRLMQEPGRLARRYLIDGLPFAIFLLGRVAVLRIQSSGSGVSDTSKDMALASD